MANQRLEPVNYRPFRVDPKLSDGLLSVARDGGDLERKVAAGFARMADTYAREAADIAESEGARLGRAAGHAGAPGTVTVSGEGSSGYRVYTGSGIDQAKALLRDEEGFRETPYWDVNAHRVGYGSDTVTLADGRSVKVTQGVKISRDDAERDLNYRLSAREGAQVRRQIGEERFNGLAPNVQAALYSVGYNYGSLPSNVVSAVQGGDISAVASAVASLTSNPSRRKREAAMISGGGSAPSGETTGSIAPSASSVGPVTVTPGRAGSFKPSGKNTIFGRAYDVAGTKTYLEELKFTMLQDQEAVYQAYRDDPVMLKKALGELETAHMQEHVLPEIADEYSLDFRKQAFLRVKEAEEAARQRRVVQDKADYIGRVGSLEEQKSQLLARVGMGDQGAFVALAGIQKDIDSHYDSGLARGVYTEQEVVKAKKRSQDEVTVGAYVGQSANKKPEEIAAMRTEIYDRWSRGLEPDIDADSMAKINAGLQAAENQEEARGKLADKALIERGNDIATRKMRGLPVSAEEVARFSLDIGTAPNGKNIGVSTMRRVRLAEAIRTQPVRDVEANLWKILAEDGEDVTPDDYDFAVKAIDAHKSEVIKDPLSVAERYGVVPDQTTLPDPATASPDEMAAALNARMVYADVAADYFGVPSKYFKPEEEETLKRAVISTDPEQHASGMKQLDIVAAKGGLLEVERIFGRDAVDRLQDWQAKVRYSTPGEAAQWLKERNDPQWQERVRPLVAKGQTEARKLTADDVGSLLDDSGMLSFSAGGPVDGTTQRSMMNDFVTLTGERYAVTGDISLAKEQAIERMRKVWGKTDAFGGRGGRLMLYPPEEHYPTVAGSRQWISDELTAVAKERGIDVANMSLVSDSKTKAAIERNEAPGYLLSRVDPETGLEELVTDEKGRPLRHFFDPKAAQAKAAEKAEEGRRTRNDPWLVFGKGTAIGPLYPGGASQAELEGRQKRIDEIMDDRGERRREREQMRERLRNAEIPGLPVPPEDQ